MIEVWFHFFSKCDNSLHQQFCWCIHIFSKCVDFVPNLAHFEKCFQCAYFFQSAMLQYYSGILFTHTSCSSGLDTCKSIQLNSAFKLSLKRANANLGLSTKFCKVTNISSPFSSPESTLALMTASGCGGIT